MSVITQKGGLAMFHLMHRPIQTAATASPTQDDGHLRSVTNLFKLWLGSLLVPTQSTKFCRAALAETAVGL